MDPVLSIETAAKHLECSANHVRNLVRAGALPAVDISQGKRRLVRIRTADLEQFLAGRAVAVPGPKSLRRRPSDIKRYYR